MEKRLWVQHQVRGFVLTGRTSQSTTDSVALIERQWAWIDRLVVERPSGSWMYAVTTSGLREIEL